MLLEKRPLQVTRIQKFQNELPEIKDPSIVKVKDKWMMYASIGNSLTQQWKVGRFVSNAINGQWIELEPVKIDGLQGPQLCAPAMLYQKDEKQWIMYIQTACFEENGVISKATSKDGNKFTGVASSLLRSDMIRNSPHRIVGLYDAGISEVNWMNEKLTLMVFSGYRSVGNGDLYLTYKKSSDTDVKWNRPQLLLSQEEVPFHNKPNSKEYEWGLEGAKIIELSKNNYLLIGVCFAALPLSYIGHRQRVFLASSKSPFGPFKVIGIPFLPISLESKTGEQGHPDTVIEDNSLWIVYQERKNNKSPWYLNYAKIDLQAFAKKIASYSLQSQTSYYFDMSKFA